MCGKNTGCVDGRERKWRETDKNKCSCNKVVMSGGTSFFQRKMAMTMKMYLFQVHDEEEEAGLQKKMDLRKMETFSCS